MTAPLFFSEQFLKTPKVLSDALHGYSEDEGYAYTLSPYKTPQDALATVLDIPLLILGTSLEVADTLLGILKGIFTLNPRLILDGLSMCPTLAIAIPVFAVLLIGTVFTRAGASIVDFFSNKSETKEENVSEVGAYCI